MKIPKYQDTKIPKATKRYEKFISNKHQKIQNTKSYRMPNDSIIPKYKNIYKYHKIQNYQKI